MLLSYLHILAACTFQRCLSHVVFKKTLLEMAAMLLFVQLFVLTCFLCQFDAIVCQKFTYLKSYTTVHDI